MDDACIVLFVSFRLHNRALTVLNSGSSILKKSKVSAVFPVRNSAVSVRQRKVRFPQLADDLLLFSRNRNEPRPSKMHSLLSHKIAEILDDDNRNQTNNNHHGSYFAAQ